MRSRGRRSTVELSTPRTVAVLPQRRAPAADVSAEVAKVWRAVAATKPVDWWDAGNYPLLAAYSATVVENRRVFALLDQMNDDERETSAGLRRYAALLHMVEVTTKLMMGLATKMRLAQQSRYSDRGAAGVAERHAPGRRPWEWGPTPEDE